MYFGKYLVDNNIIDKELLISSVVKQMNSLPSSLEALVEINTVSTEDICSYINESVSNNEDIVNVVHRYKPELVDNILEYQRSKCKNLIDIIVADSDVSKDVIDSAYEKFTSSDLSNEENETSIPQELAPKESSDESLISAAALESLKELQGEDFDVSSLTETESEAEAKEPENSVETEDISSEVEISAAALESLKEIGGVASDDLESLEKLTASVQSLEPSVELSDDASNYISVFSEKKNKKIGKILKMIKDAASGNDDIGNYLNSLFRELHVVKGAASLVEAKYTKKLIVIWESILDKLFKLENEELKAWVHSYHRTLVDSADLVWEIRNCVAEGSTEESFMQLDTSRTKYLTTVGSLKNIINEIS